MLDRFATFLDQHQRVLLTSHENPDGDGIGAAIGLAHYLRALGKEVRIVLYPHVPENLAWVDPGGWIEAYDPEGAHRELAAWPDAWLLIDASEPHRMGTMYAAYERTKAVRACLDHHLKDAPKGFDQEFTDPTASASGQLVYKLAGPRMGEPLPLPMAKALYVSLVSDTGNFRFSNATAEIHEIAARLIAQGVEPARTYQALYHQERPAKFRIMAKAFEGMRMIGGDRAAVMVVTMADLAATGATHDDLDELVQQPLRLAGVEVSALLYETAEGRVKLSLRSRERVNVNAVCRAFGGGGHFLASGAKLEGPMEAAYGRVQAALEAQLDTDLASRASQ